MSSCAISPAPISPLVASLWVSMVFARLTRPDEGKITMRGRAIVEQLRNGKEAIIISEIPFQVNKANLIESIANLVKDKKG
jgi:DNA gyrase subunit A